MDAVGGSALMTKQGIGLRLQPARQTLALKGQLPDLLAKAAAGGLLSAPPHSWLTVGLCLCARRRWTEAHVERDASAFLAPLRPAFLLSGDARLEAPGFAGPPRSGQSPRPSLLSARKRWLINSDRLAAGFSLTTMVPATF